ncbi:MAG: polyprenyl synthetase family protein, partial [Burkholderiales bacterium]|nr:polyprenyl synthetase family protein [Burkholderiales bacterium]
ILSDNNSLPAGKLLKIINLIAKSAGLEGMAGGQAIDLMNTKVIINHSQLEEMHSLKTGKLIQASIMCGYLCGQNYHQSIYDNLLLISSKLGLLFQIVDDIIDVTGSTEALGKTAHKDEDNNKSTYVTILGLTDAKQYAKTLYLDIVKELEQYSGAEFLLYLASVVYSRNN